MKRLYLSDDQLSVEASRVLGHALRAGKWRNLEWLDLESGFSDRLGSLAFLQAIQPGALPNLVHLDLNDTHLYQEHGRVLGETMGTGALPQLEEVRLFDEEGISMDGFVAAMMTGVEAGGILRLKNLYLKYLGIGPQGGQALARALASGNLSFLEVIMLDGYKGEPGSPVPVPGDEAMVEVIKGLRQCAKIRLISLPWAGIGVGAGQVLLEALRDGWCQKLDWQLDVSDNPCLGDGVLGVGLAEVLGEEEGIKKLPLLSSLYVDGSGLTPGGAEGLLKVIAEGACPKLKMLNVGSQSLVKEIDEAVRDRVRARGVYMVVMQEVRPL